MASNFSITHLKPSTNSLIWYNRELISDLNLSRKKCFSDHRLRFKIVSRSPGDKWKLKYIDTNAVQERLNSWLSKTQNFFNEALVKTGNSKKPEPRKAIDAEELEDLFMAEQTINSKTPNGFLSLAAIVSIEQFSRMNGLTGEKMQKIFKTLVPEHVYLDACNLVEYCCFRFLSRDTSDIHPCLKEPAFQRLIFITMLAWENPYGKEDNSLATLPEKAYFQGKLVGKEAFVRIAPAVSGLADRATVHNLFKALAGDERGISLSLWLTYIDELIKVHEGRKLYQNREFPKLSGERVLCIASSRKRPVIKWKENMVWPGQLTLTDRALYFEGVSLLGQKDDTRFDLTQFGLKVEKAKVGPWGSVLFDSAVSVSSGPESEPLVLEFVDLGGDLRRDVWHAFINEVISSHKFIREYGPTDGDPSLSHVYGSHKGKERAITSAINAIARLQALQFMRKLLDDPLKLVQFSYLQNAPYRDIVYQTLAVNYWGGQLVTKLTQDAPSDEKYESRKQNVFDIDGSVYLHRWMRSSSWESSASLNFWKNSSTRNGVVLSKNLVVADMSVVERAMVMCKEKSRAVEKTQATIDAAMIQGVPSNIDLFKELMLPLTIIGENFERLRRWEEPHLTISFLAFAYTIILRNLLSYIFPTVLMVLASGMLTLKGLKEQGRLGRAFGKVTIRDQPPSNTIQKLMAVKDAMRDLEDTLQNLNVKLLKIRSIFLSGQPQITTEVALVLLSSSVVLYLVPFKYVLSFLLFDLFTRELEFRREMVQRFIAFIKERWDTVPAAPVVVLPYENNEQKEANQRKETSEEKIVKKNSQQ